MNKLTLKDIQVYEEDERYYMYLTYERETDTDIRKIRIPKVDLGLPVYDDTGLSIDTDYNDDVFDYCPLYKKLRHTLNTGGGMRYNILYDGETKSAYSEEVVFEKTRKMTVAEIEKALGYKVEIVSDSLVAVPLKPEKKKKK